jgi:hypothetical protein
VARVAAVRVVAVEEEINFAPAKVDQ